MDDNATPQIDLNLDPDMITPQTGTPLASFTPTPIAPVSPGVIDITPGSSTESDFHPPKTVDISPPSSLDTGSHLADLTPQLPVSGPTPVIPITPVVTPPVLSEQTSPLAEDPDLVKLNN